MADSRLRILERKFRESGDVNDEAAYLQARVREGGIQNYRVWIAARAGHPAARLLHPTSAPFNNWLDLGADYDWHHNQMLPIVIATAACRHFRRHWNLQLPLDNPTHWIESHGGRCHYWNDEQTRSIALVVELDEVKVTSALPFRQLRTRYPNFDGHPLWSQMVNRVRNILFEQGRNYVLMPTVWGVADIFYDFTRGLTNRSSLLGYAQMTGSTIILMDVEWAGHLLSMVLRPFQIEEHFHACVSTCLSADGTHQAINEGVIEWALR